MLKLKMLTIIMMNNKKVNNHNKPIKVKHNKFPNVVKTSRVKVKTNKLLSLSVTKVKHIKHEISKDKTIDNLESVVNNLTKPVDKIHISYLMLMGKKKIQ